VRHNASREALLVEPSTSQAEQDGSENDVASHPENHSDPEHGTALLIDLEDGK
jgi:hypothetical protein